MIAALIIIVVTLGSAAVAMTLRNLIHSCLLLILSWAGIAAFYLWAGADFVAFAQALVYVGAISMVVLFAVLLTRQTEAGPGHDATPARVILSVLAAAGIAGLLSGAVLATSFGQTNGPAPTATVRELGVELMGNQTAGLLVIGVILTVALLGAVVIAATRSGQPEDSSS